MSNYKYGETYIFDDTEMIYLGKDGCSGFFRNKESARAESVAIKEAAKANPARPDPKFKQFYKEQQSESWEGKFTKALFNKDYITVPEEELEVVWEYITKYGFPLKGYGRHSPSLVVWDDIYRVTDKAYYVYYNCGKIDNPIKILEIM